MRHVGRPRSAARLIVQWCHDILGTDPGTTALPALENPALLGSGRYQITEMAERLVALMHETLAEACASRSAAVVQLGVGAVRDIAALLVALPPVTRSKELQARILQGAAPWSNSSLFTSLNTRPVPRLRVFSRLSKAKIPDGD